jgi:hypothetical protein
VALSARHARELRQARDALADAQQAREDAIVAAWRGTVTLTWSNGDTMFQKSSRNPTVWAGGPVTTSRQPAPFLQPLDRDNVQSISSAPGTPMYHHLPAQIDGGSIVRDGNVLRMAFGVWYGSHFESNLADSYPSKTTMTATSG